MRSLSTLAVRFGRWRGQAEFLARRIRNKIARTLGDRSVPPSRLALKYLRGLEGLEIGGSAHNPFGLKTKNVDFQAELDTVFKEFEIKMCGKALPVDIVASGDELPVADESQDFVISSHVIEHFFDPVKALLEWNRVIRPGGYIFVIAPHKERTFDRDRPRTPLAELIARHDGRIPRPAEDTHEHYSVWITEDFLELCHHLGLRVVDYQDVDDKVGNGFTIVVKKEGDLQRPAAHGITSHFARNRAA